MFVFPLRRHRLTAAGPEPTSRLRGQQSGIYAQRVASAQVDRRAWTALWRTAADGCGLAEHVRPAAGGITVSAPRLGVVREYDDRTDLTVEMRAGQSPADYVHAGPELARALGGVRLAVVELGGMWLRLSVLAVDPLARPFRLPSAVRDGFLGVADTGLGIAVPWARRAHTLVAGQTGSGKSMALYGWLAALAERDDVILAGIDPSRLLFEPWRDAPRSELRVSGLGDELVPHRAVLRALCEELDKRLAVMPAGVDAMPTGPDMPLVVAVFEELPGLYRAADVTGTNKAVGNEVRGGVARLLSEGRKVGMRIVLAAQRPDVSIIDGAARAQCSLRVTFASEPDGVRMSHPASAVPDIDSHAQALPGVALVTAPQLGTHRIRAGHLPYGEYCTRVERALTARTAA